MAEIIDKIMEHKSLIKIWFAVIFLFFSTSIVLSQGAWNINYIPVDSINNSFMNKEVRLDFKGSYTDIIKKKISVFDIRKLLSKKDTVNLKIDGKPYKFIENWAIYVDHGVLKEQTLLSIAKEDEEQLIIKELFIKSIDESTLTLKAYVYQTVSCRKNKKHKKMDEQDIVIKKSTLKGVLLRN